MPASEPKGFLEDKLASWRNKIKSNLSYYLQRLLFPLKGLGVQGCRYSVTLGNFTDPSVNPRSFTLSGEDSGFGDLVGVRSRLFSGLETISEEVEACFAVLLLLNNGQLEHPLRSEQVPRLVDSALTVKELSESLAALAVASEEELHEDAQQRETHRKKVELLATVPLKNFVRYRWLLLPAEQPNINN